MSRFYHDIAVLVHRYNMEILMEKVNLVLMEECLESISLNLFHLDNTKDNIFSCDETCGDTFKGLFLTVNSLKSLLCNKNQDGSMI